MGKINNNFFLILFSIISLLYQSSYCFEYLGYRCSNNNFPVYRINENGTSDCTGEFTAIANAAQTWNNVSTTYINFQVGSNTAVNVVARDYISVIRWVEDNWEDEFPEYPTALAVNSNWVTGGTLIVESDISFNGESNVFSDNGQGNDVQAIALHEMGHTVGLDDITSSTNTVMYYSNQNYRTLRSDDINGARYINFEAQTAGTFSENQIWDQNLTTSTITLTNNLNTSSYSATIKTGMTVNLDDFCLVSGSGSITFETGSTLNDYNVSLKQSSTVKGYSGSLSVLSYASSGQIAEVINSCSFSGNISIPSGVELKVNSGTTLTCASSSALTFASTASFNVYGTLTATNTTFNFTTPYSGNGIIMQSGSTLNASGLTVQNAWYGIYRTRGVNNVTATGCQYGIYVYGTNGNGDLITGNSLHGNSVGIALYNFNYGTEEIYSNDIYSNTSQGIYLSNSSPEIYGNNIYSNSSYGINVYNSSYPCIGKVYPPITCGSYNNIYSSGSYNLYNQVSGVLYALYNWWGSNPPSSSKFYSTNGTIVYDPYLTSAYGSKLSKSASNASAGDNGTEDYVSPLREALEKAMYYVGAGQLSSAREICLDMIENYPDSAITFNALNLLQKTYLSDKEDVAESKMELRCLFDNSVKKNLYGMAGLMLAHKDSDSKLKILDEVISKYKGEDIIELALYDKFLYYLNEEKNTDDAKAVLAELDELFPGCEGSIDAHRTLGDGKEYAQRNYAVSKDASIKEPPKEFEVAGNYPNPFNPTTTIQFGIPADGNVSIKVFDIMGREVATLVNQNKQAGTYNVIWDSKDNFGNEVSSGIYFYNIRFKDQSFSKKMVLVR